MIWLSLRNKKRPRVVVSGVSARHLLVLVEQNPRGSSLRRAEPLSAPLSAERACGSAKFAPHIEIPGITLRPRRSEGYALHDLRTSSTSPLSVIPRLDRGIQELWMPRLKRGMTVFGILRHRTLLSRNGAPDPEFPPFINYDVDIELSFSYHAPRTGGVLTLLRILGSCRVEFRTSASHSDAA
jgi:hypothetical protein